MKLRLMIPLFAGAALAPLFAPSDAEACGGCFHPIQQTGSTVVTGHRMAVSISPTQSVLWDQIEYAGSPSDFAWVLPIKPGAYIEVASSAWIEALDAATTIQVTSPAVTCPNSGSSGGGIGCGAASADMASGMAEPSANGGGGVTIVHQGIVGPYKTVTLQASQQGVLGDWLNTNGYAVDKAEQPIIDAYVAEHFDFIALQLAPGAGIQQMQPVRVITPGGGVALPLRMVAAGTGANVAITLFVIGEGRWAPQNFPTTSIAVDLLAWDFGDQSSNYATLRKSALAQNDGRSWLTPYAKLGALLQPMPDPTSYTGNLTYTTGSGPAETIGAAYVMQGVSNGDGSDTSCLSAMGDLASSAQLVGNPCPAGVGLSDPSCGSVPGDQIDPRNFACTSLDDLAVALIGMHPKDVWLTRLESNLPRAALSADLQLEAASSQTEVDNNLQAHAAEHLDAICGSSAAPLGRFPKSGGGGRPGPWLAVWLAGLGLAAAARRLRRPALAAR